MDASGRNAIVTLLANLLSERLDEEQLAAAASVITQLGTTLGFLAAQRALDATRNLMPPNGRHCLPILQRMEHNLPSTI